jgi:transposase
MARCIGIDLHQRRFTVCIREADGREQQHTCRLDRLDEFLAQLRPDDEVAVEATANSTHFAEQVTPHVARVHRVNPVQFQVVSASAKKTDANDAALLALFLAKGLLPEVRPSDAQREEIKSLVSTREQLVEARTALKNKVHSVLAAHGLAHHKVNVDSLRGHEQLLALAQDATMRLELEVLTEQIRHLSAAIVRLEKALNAPERRLPGHEQITSIPGIGNLGAATLLCAIGPIGDFADAAHLASYFGLVPSVHRSDATSRYGPITKRGNRHARRVLVQCTLIAIRYHAGLRAFYDRIRARRGGGKAIVATAHKLLGLIHYTLTRKIVWQDCAAGLIAA